MEACSATFAHVSSCVARATLVLSLWACAKSEAKAIRQDTIGLVSMADVASEYGSVLRCGVANGWNSEA